MPDDYPYDNTTAILEEEYRDRKQVLSELAALNENINTLNRILKDGLGEVIDRLDRRPRQ